MVPWPLLMPCLDTYDSLVAVARPLLHSPLLLLPCDGNNAEQLVHGQS